jgi:hypothetical protein
MKKNIKHIWPESESPCIWMEAGVVDFKLCDFNNNCDTCPFDAIMRNRATCANITQNAVDSGKQNNDSVEQFLNPLKTINVDGHVFYGEKHWYFERLSENKTLVGFDQVTLSIFPTFTDIIISEEQRINKGQAVCWFVSEFGTMCLPAPISGKITKVNNSFLNDRKTDKTRIWLFIIETENLPNELANFKKGDDAIEYLKINQSEYSALFARELEQIQPSLGATLPDGGQAVQSLEQLFGAKKHWALIYNFVQQCNKARLR